MTSAKKTFEIREARINGARANAYVYVEPGQPPLEVGAKFRLTARGVELLAGGPDLWEVVSIVKVPGTGLWSVDFTSSP